MKERIIAVLIFVIIWFPVSLYIYKPGNKQKITIINTTMETNKQPAYFLWNYNECQFIVPIELKHRTDKIDSIDAGWLGFAKAQEAKHFIFKQIEKKIKEIKPNQTVFFHEWHISNE